VATPETEARLLAVARGGTAEHVERIVRGWRRVDRRAEAREAALRRAGRALHVYQEEDGTVIVRGRLEPAVGAVLLQALTAAREALYKRARRQDRAGVQDADAGPVDVPAETPTMVQQQADALALLAETALHHGIDPGAPGERYQVVVHVDASVLADADAPGQSLLEDGARVPAGTSQRRCSIATIVVASRAVERGSVRAITSATGPTEAPPRSRISPCSAAGTTVLFTRRATRSIDWPRVSFASAVPTVGCYPTSRRPQRFVGTPWRLSGHSIRRRGSRCTR
jgi:hypothetical protein